MGFFTYALTCGFGLVLGGLRYGSILVFRMIKRVVIVLVVVIIRMILPMVMVIVLMVLILLRPGVEVEIIAVVTGLWIREMKGVGEIIGSFPEKVADFAVVYKMILREREGLGFNVFDVDEFNGLLGRVLVEHGVGLRPMREMSMDCG